MSIEIKLHRSSRIYRPSELVQGKIVVELSHPISHGGVRMTVDGTVNLQVRAGMAGVVESLYSVVKPIPIVKQCIVVQSSGKFGAGRTEIPFSIDLSLQGHGRGERFYETYHGANISIQYLISVDIARGYLHKSLSETIEVIIESDRDTLSPPPVSPGMVSFYITQDTQKHPLLPELLAGGFRIIGRISAYCSLTDPISGTLMVEASAVPIASIDIQLLRVESILVGDRIASDISVVQTTQVADGDVHRSLSLPIYVMIPRLLTCPTLLAGPFSIEFKVSVIITFKSELATRQPKSDLRTPRLWLAMETIPLELVRTR